jgi:nucleoside-diphosphate-sugar epimerase
MRRGAPPVQAVVHLAAIAGHPAAEAAGREVVWRQNVEAAQIVFEESERLGVGRFALASTSSVYGVTPKGREAAEEDPLNPLSLYAESKARAEEVLQDASRAASCALLVFRFATAFGISPRMRFDLLLNQLVQQARERGEIEICRGSQSRTFVHVRDIADGVAAGLEAPVQAIQGRVFNLGIESNTCTKDELATLIAEAIPGTRIRRPDQGSGGDERDLRLSFARIRDVLGVRPRVSVAEGIAELVSLLRAGLIPDPGSSRYRNTAPIAVESRSWRVSLE